jgi:hypothetical protein
MTGTRSLLVKYSEALELLRDIVAASDSNNRESLMNCIEEARELVAEEDRRHEGIHSHTRGPAMDRKTIQILLDLLNPLHASLDKQVGDQLTDEREIDPPADREYNVNITKQQERDLTQAVCILENRKNDTDTRASGYVS